MNDVCDSNESYNLSSSSSSSFNNNNLDDSNINSDIINENNLNNEIDNNIQHLTNSYDINENYINTNSDENKHEYEENSNEENEYEENCEYKETEENDESEDNENFEDSEKVKEIESEEHEENSEELEETEETEESEDYEDNKIINDKNNDIIESKTPSTPFSLSLGENILKKKLPPPPQRKKDGLLLNPIKNAPIPPPLTPRTVNKLTSNTVPKPIIPQLSQERALSLTPTSFNEINKNTPLTPIVSIKSKPQRKSLPISKIQTRPLISNKLQKINREKTKSVQPTISGIPGLENTSQNNTEYSLRSTSPTFPLRPVPPRPPRPSRTFSSKRNYNLNHSDITKRSEDNKNNIEKKIQFKGDNICNNTSQSNENSTKPAALIHTLSSPNLSDDSILSNDSILSIKLPPKPPTPPPRKDINKQSRKNDKKKKDTHSNVNWEDLESQIRESPLEEIHSARGLKSKKRWCNYWENSVSTQSMESERMRRFAIGSCDSSELLTSRPFVNYDLLFDEFVQDHRNSVSTPPLTRKSQPDIEPEIESETEILEIEPLTLQPPRSPTTKRKRSSSTLVPKFNIITRTSDKESSDKSDKSSEKSEKKKKKKIFKLIKGSKDSPDSLFQSSINYILEGKKFLDSVRGSNEITLEHFLNNIKQTTLLTKTLSKYSIDNLYYDKFEEDECLSIEYEENSNDIAISHATIFKLVQKLSLPASLDPLLRSVFLLTYRSFVTPKELLELFICRAFSKPSPTNTEETEKWKIKQPLIQNRIIIVLSTWIGEYYQYDFSNNQDIIYLLAHFINFLSKLPNINQDLVYCCIGNISLDDDNTFVLPSKKNKIPKPYVPKISGTIKLVHLHPTEVARQLALVEKEIFDKITPGEYAHQGWTRDDKLTRSPNIVRMITRFNDICNWAASEILKEKKLKERAIILHRLIIIAEESRALCNYNSVMAIISGLQSASIYRLSDTWDLLPSKTWDIWDNLNELMSNENNFAEYRKKLGEVTELKNPCIPYIGIYLTDLVFVEDGNIDYKPDTDLINVKKLKFASSIMYRLEKCKTPKYRLTPVWSVQGYIASAEKFTEEKQKELSLEIQGLD